MVSWNPRFVAACIYLQPIKRSQRVCKAARQLESRTPGEKLDDAASDAGEDLRKATNQQ
jgi:hypothetical protein